MRKIVLFLIFALFYINNVSAISFSNFTSAGTGNISEGNGYFNDDALFFGYTGSRNVYAVAEAADIYLVEPISWTSGTSPTVLNPVHSNASTIRSALVNDGYLYFVDGSTLKKKKSRNDGSFCYSDSTLIPTGCIQVIATGVAEPLAVYNNALYFYSSDTSLSTVDSYGNVISVFTVSASSGGHKVLAVTNNNSILSAYVDKFVGPNHIDLAECNATGCTSIRVSGTGDTTSKGHSLYATTNYIYEYMYTLGVNTEKLYYISNSTPVSVNYITNDLYKDRRIYVGGLSTVGLISMTATEYTTFNSIEIGAGVTIVPTSTPQEDILGPLSNLSNQIINVDSDGDGVISDIEIKSTGNKFIPILFLLVALILIVGTYNKLTGKR